MIQKNTLSSDHEWIEVIHACLSSGLSIREWCRTSGISRNSLYYHIRKLRAMGHYFTYPSKGDTCEQEVVPLVIVENGSSSNEYRSSQMPRGIAASISIGNICIDIHNDASSTTIRDILSALTGGLPC